METLNRENRNFILTSIIIITVLLCGDCWFLYSHYVWDNGLCVSILHYQPLSAWGRIIFVSFGIMACLGILLVYRNLHSTNIRMATFAITLCLLLSIVFSVFGNQILGSRTEHWPDEYKVQPLNTLNSKD